MLNYAKNTHPQSKFDPTTPMDGIEKKVLFQEGDEDDEAVDVEVTDEKSKVESKVGKGDSPINMSDFVKDEDIEALASALNATDMPPSVRAAAPRTRWSLQSCAHAR